jgi:indole-3-glycerol phosphate synthase
MSQDILTKIISKKRIEISEQSNEVSLETIKAIAKESPKPRGFAKTIKNSASPKIIAEIKFGSPAKGFVRPDLDPATVATSYAKNSATCLSILTDRTFFNGALSFVPLAREKLSKLGIEIPILRKDFIVDIYQVWQTRAMQADAILLIVAALTKQELKTLISESLEAELDLLIEVHSREELLCALEAISSISQAQLSPTASSSILLGINNRSLKTLDTNLETSFELAKTFQDETNKYQGLKEQITLISESGIKAAQDLIALESAGFSGFLIGGSLTFQGDPGQNLASILNDYKKLTS